MVSAQNAGAGQMSLADKVSGRFLLRCMSPQVAQGGHLRRCSGTVCCRGYSRPIQRRGPTPAIDVVDGARSRHRCAIRVIVGDETL
jgi:hypothetical protein